MFAPAIAVDLRHRGHDVMAVAEEPSLRAMTDEEVYAWAGKQRRRIVTENVKDFRPLMRQAGRRGTPGLLFTSSRIFPRDRKAVGRLITALDTWLRQPDALSRPTEDWLTSPEPRPPRRRAAADR